MFPPGKTEPPVPALPESVYFRISNVAEIEWSPVMLLNVYEETAPTELLSTLTSEI